MLRNRVGAALAAAAVLLLLVATPALATPANVPSEATAQAELNALTVAAEGSLTGYSRDLFPHWITITGKCNARETVLKRDGTCVIVDGYCNPPRAPGTARTTGHWTSSERRHRPRRPARRSVA